MFNLRKESEEHIKWEIGDKKFDLNITKLKERLLKKDRGNSKTIEQIKRLFNE